MATNKPFRPHFRLLVLVLLIVLGHSAHAGFSYYSPITVDHTKVPSTQTDFPILISQTGTRFKTTGNGGHVQSSSGFDIRPYSDSALTSALTYELERYNATTGEVVMWVKISSLSSSSDTTIYLAYGNSALTTDGSSTSTWSNSFSGVYHLKDGTTLSTSDSTSHANNGTNHSATATSGKIDGAASFASASSQYVDLPSMTSAGVTLSAWVNATSFPNAYNGVLGWNSGPNVNYALLMVKSTGKLACYTNVRNYDGTGSNTLSSGTTYYLVMVYDSTNGLVGYVNGSSDGTGTANGALGTPSQDAAIGQDAGNSGRFWNGTIDEARIASVARSANWITTEYNNQNSPSTFETLGTEVALATNTSQFLFFFP